jgi:glycine cleavage system H protein
LNPVGDKEATMAYPSDYRYTDEHEWVRVEGDVATVGITDYAQHELGDVVYVELPKVGAKLTAGQSLGTVESVKAVSDIYAPVSGEVTEVNSSLADAPETINKDPHGKAWLIKLKLANAGEVSKLMNASAYEAFISDKQKEASA